MLLLCIIPCQGSVKLNNTLTQPIPYHKAHYVANALKLGSLPYTQHVSSYAAEINYNDIRRSDENIKLNHTSQQQYKVEQP